MTKILTGITFALVLLMFGMISPSLAISEPNQTQNSVLRYTVTKNTKLDQQILVADFPSVKGGKAVFHWIPKPQEGINGIQIATQASPELILASIHTANGENVLKLIPTPQEGIDGLFVQKPITKTNPSLLIGDTSIISRDSLLKSTPKIQEGIDDISIPKSTAPPMMIVAEPVSKGKIAILHLVPVLAPNPKDSTS